MENFLCAVPRSGAADKRQYLLYQKRKLEISVKIGEKLKSLRQEKLLTQNELADRCELSKGFISQLERDLTSPSLSTLEDILEVLGTDIREFFNETQQEKIVFSDEDFYEFQNEELGYEIKWIIPNAQKNKMEPILITLEPGGRYKLEVAHEGEEFGYVISGRIRLHLGDKSYVVKSGESFYFRANRNHFIENTGSRPAKFVWVSTPPTF